MITHQVSFLFHEGNRSTTYTAIQILESAASRMHPQVHCKEIPLNASSPHQCKLGYRFLPWNPEVENFVGALTGIEPASPAFRADMLSTAPQHPGDVMTPNCTLSLYQWTAVVWVMIWGIILWAFHGPCSGIAWNT